MPLGDRVLVKPFKPEDAHKTTSFGIIIPDTSAKEKPEQGTVVAVGPGKKNEDGRVVPMSVKVGDKVMFSKYGFDEIKVNGVEYYIVTESSILAILD
ncbi:MAG TPA: co-chaperone GroES [Candidatus Paceibacterota bacterium]|nr:co-chaperone GroES [Candidatus Paceibacterota bacterium]